MMMMMMMMITIIIRKKAMSSVFCEFFGFIMKKVWRDSWSIQVLLGPRPARRMSIKSSRSLFGTRTTQKKREFTLGWGKFVISKKGYQVKAKWTVDEAEDHHDHCHSLSSSSSSFSSSNASLLPANISKSNRYCTAKDIITNTKHGLWSTHINTTKHQPSGSCEIYTWQWWLFRAPFSSVGSTRQKVRTQRKELPKWWMFHAPCWLKRRTLPVTYIITDETSTIIRKLTWSS